MKKFPQDIGFKYPWRAYQQRILDALSIHLEDRHLHVIAPPGSGKTVLGLEVAIRLNKPSLILAPTIAIRNQWIQRLCELFLRTMEVPDWISTNIRKPKFVTVVTYQGLQEIVDPIENPRYLITREHSSAGEKKRVDYHAVPEIIGKNHVTVAYFELQWIKRVGNTQLIFTRSLEGRKLLLQARLKSLSAQFTDPTEQVSKWL